MSVTRVNIDHRPGCRQSSGLRRHGNLLTCRACGISATIPTGDPTPAPDAPPPGPPAPYVLVCIDCDRPMWTFNPKPRVPLCARCRRTRTKPKPKPPPPPDYLT